jgi:hypothetical protein
MTSHELAKLLLENEDLPIASHADNNDSFSLQSTFRVGKCMHYLGMHIIVGNFSRKNLNGTNWHITEMITEDIPYEWTGWANWKRNKEEKDEQ